MNSFSNDLKEFADTRSGDVALIESRNAQQWTWRELDRLVDLTGGWLRTNNILAGQSIVAALPNAVETFVLFLACIRFGNLMAPVAPQSTPRELHHWLDMVRPAALVIEAGKKFEISSSVNLLQVQIDTRFDWCRNCDSSLAVESSGFLCIPTSGTTGTPKPLVHEGERLWESGKRFIDFHSEAIGGRYLNNLPMSYLGGMFNLGLLPLSSGGSTVITNEFSGKSFFNYWRDIERFQIDVLWLVPTIIRGLLAVADRTPEADRIALSEKVRFGFLGTAPIDLETKRRFENTLKIRLLENFGLSETTFVTSERHGDDQGRSEGSVGAKLPYTDLELRPVFNEENSSEEVLEVYARTPFMAKGYLQPDGTILDPRDKDGYLATGDIGSWDDAGNLVLTGRSRDVIKKGGLLVSLREIEIVAEGHPSIVEAAAVPVSHDFYGESAVLFVLLQDPEAECKENILEDIESYLAANLSRHKLPESVAELPELPKTSSGKIRKSELAKEFL